ncbi:MAG: DegT/DnrJ/EryC1/StrS family aminotransferase [Armatimonadota bacterium]|nr:MAG: DegT/DnrJ/EryC1/StrS family aminotransferase [Armatimonadota bacterium]
MLKIGKQEADAAARVITSGKLFRFLPGKPGELGECAWFEKELAEKTGTKYALLVTSGTGALICALAGLGVGPGDEVIVPAYTFMASPAAVLAVGAVPIIAEVDESLMLDPADAEAKLTKRTAAIMPVHMSGLPANMDGVMRIARKHRLRVIEDACQADGGSYKGKRLGSIGHVGAFSFNYYKNITCGEGGAVVTDNPTIYERAIIQHDPGTAFRPHRADLSIEPFIGGAYRMNEILAAVLRVQLKRVDGLLAKMRNHKRRVVAAIADSGLRLLKNNDPEGDCATTLGLIFDSEDEARAFVTLIAPGGAWAYRPIDSGRHVYSNWDPILERRGAYHPAMNPYLRPENRGSKPGYSQNMCPRTTDLLSRAVLIGISPEWTVANRTQLIKAIKQAAREMGKR